jgi:hypothetical protein
MQMDQRRLLTLATLVALIATGCGKGPPKKPDATKGVVTGIVLCADTGKPARFALVTLSSAPSEGETLEHGNPLPETETAMTGLDGRFRMEAVEPGRYYAFARLEGYADPMLGIDFDRIRELTGDKDQAQDAIKQWKDHLTSVTVGVHRASEISLSVERGAELNGTVTFDDGSPAIGMHFEAFRKVTQDAKTKFSEVGLHLFNDLPINVTSDGHGRYSLTGLSGGEYTLCALMPYDKIDSAPRVCLGNVFRMKDAKSVKVQAGEIANGVDIEIPLNGLHTVSGNITALADGHAINHATVRLLFADDREKARESAPIEDGGFTFEYVPEGKYIVQVTGAQDAEPDQPAESGNEAKAKPAIHYADKEIPVTVEDDLGELQIQLVPVAADNSVKQSSAPQ